jgi:hypothetical protein
LKTPRLTCIFTAADDGSGRREGREGEQQRKGRERGQRAREGRSREGRARTGEGASERERCSSHAEWSSLSAPRTAGRRRLRTGSIVHSSEGHRGYQQQCPGRVDDHRKGQHHHPGAVQADTKAWRGRSPPSGWSMHPVSSQTLGRLRSWRCGRWLLGGLVVASLTAACGQPVDAAAYRQACNGYTAAMAAIVSVHTFERVPLPAGLPEFRLGALDAQRSHDPQLVRAFENLITDAVTIQAAGPASPRVPKKIASSIRGSAGTIARGCKGEDDPIPTKSPFRLVSRHLT